MKWSIYTWQSLKVKTLKKTKWLMKMIKKFIIKVIGIGKVEIISISLEDENKENREENKTPESTENGIVEK